MMRIRSLVWAVCIAIAIMGAPRLVAAQTIMAPTTTTLPKTGLVTKGTPIQSSATATGNGTTLDTSQMATVGLQLVGTFNATVTPEGSFDGGTTWNTLTCYPLGSSTASTALSVQTIYRCNIAGIPAIRARISAYISGTLSVYAFGSSAPMSIGTLTP